MKISSYLDSDLITFLTTEDRDEALAQLVRLAHNQGLVQEQKKFFDAVLNREHIVSTGVGMGVAIPHAKLPEITNFFIIMGIAAQGIEWQSLDGAPVRIIFLIGGPDSKQTEYLQILSSLTERIKVEENRKKILTLKSKESIIKIFSS